MTSLTFRSMFEKMAREISVATTIITDPRTAPSEIDRCLATMLHESRPCYIGVPVDVSHLMCDRSGLETPLSRTLPSNDAESEQKLVQELKTLLEKSKSPVLIVDGNAVRNNLVA